MDRPDEHYQSPRDSGTLVRMRYLAPVRLSRKTDESTNPASQRASITDYADDAKGGPHEIIWCEEDLDVSGAVPIRDRPGVGPWLTSENLGAWDAICGHELDRLFRDMRDFVNFARDMRDKHGKIIIDVSDGTDTSTPRGMEILEDRALHAERERTRMSERRGKAARRIREAARWNGGKVPYGFESYKDEDSSCWYLRPAREQGDIVRWMAGCLIDGMSANSLVVELNDLGVRTATGKHWRTHTLLEMLRNPVLRGCVMHYPKRVNGKRSVPQIVLGRDGHEIRRQAVLDDETWNGLQAALDKNRTRQSGNRADGTMLLRVAECGLCGRPYWGDRDRYRCSGDQKASTPGADRCTASSIPKELLEDTVEASFAAEFGDKPMLEKRIHPGSDHSKQLTEAGRQIAALTEERFVRRVIRPDHAALMASLEAEHARLEGLKPEPGWVEMIDTGKTLGARWATLDRPGKGRLLRDIGLTAGVVRDDEYPCLIEWGTRGDPGNYPQLRAYLDNRP